MEKEVCSLQSQYKQWLRYDTHELDSSVSECLNVAHEAYNVTLHTLLNQQL